MTPAVRFTRHALARLRERAIDPRLVPLAMATPGAPGGYRRRVATYRLAPEASPLPMPAPLVLYAIGGAIITALWEDR